MKNLFFITLLLAALSCDKVDNPFGDTKVVDANCIPPTFPTNTSTKRNILVEDFTGHLCNNCPSAAYVIDTIKNNIGSQVIPVGIHVTSQFAAPDASKAPKYQSDYRTDGGTDIKANFAPAAGLPAMMVSRIDTFNSPARFNLSIYTLPSSVRKLIDDVPVVKLQVLTSFNSSTGLVCAFAETEINTVLPDDHSIVFMLLEDSIVDWQLFNGFGGDPGYSAGDISNYVHKHVLRNSMNNWNGDKIITGGSNAVGDKIISSSSYKVTNSSWRTEHLEVVAFVYNNRTKEVMQAAKAKVK